MDTVTNITEAELLEALHAAAPSGEPANAKTMRELREVTGWGENRMRRALRAMQTQGRLVTYKVLRTSLDGNRRPTVLYAILPPPKSAKRK